MNLDFASLNLDFSFYLWYFGFKLCPQILDMDLDNLDIGKERERESSSLRQGLVHHLVFKIVKL